MNQLVKCLACETALSEQESHLQQKKSPLVPEGFSFAVNGGNYFARPGLLFGVPSFLRPNGASSSWTLASRGACPLRVLRAGV